MSKNATWKTYPFSTIAEYYGLIDTVGGGRKKAGKPATQATRGGITRGLHTDNGFRLRSLPCKGRTWKGTPLQTSLGDLPCPLEKGQLGLYMIRVWVSDEEFWDYLGEAADCLWQRLLKHLIKIAGTAEYNHAVEDTVEFQKLRSRIETLGLSADPQFFNDNVEISFIGINQSGRSAKVIHKGEGMALQVYNRKHGHFPLLNSKDEYSRLLGGFDETITRSRSTVLRKVI